ncbi:hypothetical protein EI555_004632, partial [Monodon monoceros]
FEECQIIAGFQREVKNNSGSLIFLHIPFGFVTQMHDRDLTRFPNAQIINLKSPMAFWIGKQSVLQNTRRKVFLIDEDMAGQELEIRLKFAFGVHAFFTILHAYENYIQTMDIVQYVAPFIEFLKAIQDGTIVLMGTYDDGATKLNDEARQLIAELGSTSITHLGFRDNWVFCGGKGIKTKSPFEQVSVLGFPN